MVSDSSKLRYYSSRRWLRDQESRVVSGEASSGGNIFIQKPLSVKFNLDAQSRPTLCGPMDCSMPGLPVHHQLPEFTQTHVHRVADAIQPSHPLSSPSPPARSLYHSSPNTVPKGHHDSSPSEGHLPLKGRGQKTQWVSPKGETRPDIYRYHHQHSWGHVDSIPPKPFARFSDPSLHPEFICPH